MTRKFSIRSLVSKLLRKRPAPPVVQPAPEAKVSTRERVRSGIEPLEGRIAPAILLDASTLTYFDPEGDKITISFSKDLFNLDSPTEIAANLRNVFKFDAGFAHVGAPDGTADVPQQLQLIDFGQAPRDTINGSFVSRAAGISFTITAEKQGANGDDLVAIGAIKGGGNALGKVIIDGDLGQIDAGAGTNKVGLKKLQVESIGKFGTTTQIQVAMPTTSNPAPDLESRINGRVKTLSVADDMQGYFHVVDSTAIVNNVTTIVQRGTIDRVVIGGSLIGNAAVATTSDNTGRIESSFDIGTVQIGTTAADGIIGGGGKNSGAITAANSILSVDVSGSIKGGATDNSGAIFSGGNLGPVTVGGDLEGAAGLRSGTIRSGGKMGAVMIGDDVLGGMGDTSGVIISGGDLGKVTISGDITGLGPHSGGVFASGIIKGVTVVGSLTGGANLASGAIEGLKSVGPVIIGGDVVGADGAGSGSIISGGELESVSITGKLDGGKGTNSGSILAGLDPSKVSRKLGNVTIGGAVLGDEGVSSGAIVSGGSIAKVSIGASLASGMSALNGGIGALSGAIYAGGAIEKVTLSRGIDGSSGAGSASIQAQGTIGRVDVAGDVTGDTGVESASILAHETFNTNKPVAGNIGKVVITGKLDGAGIRSALIEADGTLGSASVGSIEGGIGSYSGAVVSGAGLLSVGETTSVIITGAIEGGNGDHSGYVEIGGRLGVFSAGSLNFATLRAGHDIGSLTVSGNVVDSFVTARGQAKPGTATDVAIGSINITGSVSGTRILAGYDVFGGASNADAQIGAVTVGQGWTASTIVAGTSVGTDGLFGTADDELIDGKNRAAIVAKIASIVIGGAVEGSAGTTDHFGFVSGRIGTFSSGGSALALTSTGGETFELGTQSDVTVREVVPA